MSGPELKAVSKPNDCKTKSRVGEAPQRRFRASERLLQMNGAWYFATREGVNVGPYPTKAACNGAVLKFAAMIKGVRNPELVNGLMRDFMPRVDPWPNRRRKD